MVATHGMIVMSRECARTIELRDVCCREGVIKTFTGVDFRARRRVFLTSCWLTVALSLLKLLAESSHVFDFKLRWLNIFLLAPSINQQLHHHLFFLLPEVLQIESNWLSLISTSSPECSSGSWLDCCSQHLRCNKYSLELSN